MILEVLVSLIAVGAFAYVLWKLAVVKVARNAIAAASTGVSAMLDSEADDDAKEAAVRSAGFKLIQSAFSIFWRFGAALAAAVTPIFLAELIGLSPGRAVINLMLQWEYILAVSVLGMIISEVLRRRNTAHGRDTAEVNRYSSADRFFHMLAFSHPAILKTASAIDDALMPKALKQKTAPPIFITSLARGGTTALLNALHDVPGVYTHTYRNMPFLTAPVLWDRLGGGSRRNVERHERAHGDGLEIDLNSPEAFEEVVWKLCWPSKYGQSGIKCWDTADRDDHKEHFLSRHMEKIVYAQTKQGPPPTSEGARYCSKNNANIARIPFLKDAFPGCQIVVPIRHPGAHAASLLRQHNNFSKLQSEDPFVCRYMRDIGHFEFGEIHKPLLFPGMSTNKYDLFSGDYWLQYWIHAFQDVLKHKDTCLFVFQDDLRSSPQHTMDDLCGALNLQAPTLAFSDYFHSQPDKMVPEQFSPKLYEEAEGLYQELMDAAVSPMPLQPS